MKNEYCVYMHTAPNGKRYVGVTCCKPNRRWQNGYGYRGQNHFFSAINKYGWENFKHEILETGLTSEEASAKEREYIDKYKTNDPKHGYNSTDGGDIGYHLSEEHKAKIGKANAGENNGMYGHRYTEEEKRQLSENSVWRGRHHTEKTRKLISQKMQDRMNNGWKAPSGENHPMYGKKHSAESRKHMSESAKKRGCCMPKETRMRIAKDREVAVSQYSLTGEYIATYENATEAAKAVGLKSRSGIVHCTLHQNTTAGGYIWLKADERLNASSIDVQKLKSNSNNHAKRVVQYTLDGKRVAEYASAAEAGRAVGSANSSITQVCRGERATLKGYMWRYADGNESKVC